MHLTQAGCLGPCPLANVTLLVFDGKPIWFHSINSEGQVLTIYDYIEQMLAADSYLPPPSELAPNVFEGFDWNAIPALREAQTPQPVAAVSQTRRSPGILFLSHADTDLLTLHNLVNNKLLPSDFFPVRAANPAHLKNAEDIDVFLNNLLNDSQIETELVVLRLLGGKASFSHGVDKLVEWARREDKWLVCLPGTDALDPELMALSTVGVPIAHEVLAYLQLGGASNYAMALRFLSDHLLTTGYGYEPPAPQPSHGVYYPGKPNITLTEWQATVKNPDWPTLGLLFYRAHYLSGNIDFVDAMVREANEQNLNILPIFAYSLKEKSDENATLPDALQYFADSNGKTQVDAIISTLSFAMGGVNPDGPTLSGWSVEALSQLDVPVLQAITASVSRNQWESSSRGLNPLDTAMNVALPEFDGRLITVPISFKETVKSKKNNATNLDAPLVKYVSDNERIKRVIGQAKRWAVLRHKPNEQKRVVFVLTNSLGKAARIGNAVGLDAPASLLVLFEAMQKQGYQIEGLPDNSDELISDLIARCSYDVEFLSEQQLAQAAGRVNGEIYAEWFSQLPAKNQNEITERWGAPPGEAYVHDNHIALAGLEYGNVFVALQPPRGYGMNPDAIYHVPDLAPTHNYHALYRWLREPQATGGWGADAIVHVGKHGTLEWLPGKGIGLSETCYPDQLLGDLPLIYPFIINNPGEGVQAKRRAHAVIVDHMVPPMMQAETYGELTELAQLVDEYYQLESLDPSKLPLLQKQIWDLLQKTRLDQDLSYQQPAQEIGPDRLNNQLQRILSQNHGDHTHDWDGELNEDGTPVTLAQMSGKDFAHLMENIDGYLCELAGTQIRDGLHILGDVPQNERLTGLLFGLTRLPNLDIPSLRNSVATAYGFELLALLDGGGKRLEKEEKGEVKALQRDSDKVIVSCADAVERIDSLCRKLLDTLQTQNFQPHNLPKTIKEILPSAKEFTAITQTLDFICRELWPNLQRNREEITHTLDALSGRYIAAGPAGAPTRGMAHVLPTGRNFYAVDPRSLPSVAAWQVGQALAQELLERYKQDENSYPESVGLSIWGTSAMRTHGDDVAQVLALLGVRPRWQPENRRLLGVEIVPLSELRRPRIDVVCRISGFFRDAFPHLINLIDEAVKLVMAQIDEPLEMNFPRKHYLADHSRWQEAGLPQSEVEARATYRIYGSKPGAYGAGILPLIDERNWQDTTDFAEAYVNWGGYAYTAKQYGVEAKEAFKLSLSGVSVAVKNQDNREHDIFDSDDYLQYHGGMIAAIRALSGKQPHRYFGDNSDPERIKVRDLKEEALRVFRSRVVNPKWLESIQRHGYKGGLELTATVDYLFGYDATSDIMEDWMYEKVAQTYLLDEGLHNFLEKSNPWALRDMAGRLLEATKRGLWEKPSEEMLQALYEAYHDAEDFLEFR